MTTFTFDNSAGTGGHMPSVDATLANMLGGTGAPTGSDRGSFQIHMDMPSSTNDFTVHHSEYYWSSNWTKITKIVFDHGGEITGLQLPKLDFHTAVLNSGSDTLTGNDYSDLLHGGSGADYLFGRGGNDTLYGDAGEDRFDGGNGNDYIDGGEGYDFATFVGSTSRYSFERQENGDVVVTDLVGSGGRDYLTGVETFIFDNGTLTTGAIGSGMDDLLAPPVYVSGPVYVPPVYQPLAQPPLPPQQPLNNVPVYQPPKVHITGTAGDDTLVGNEIGNVITGGAGRDAMWGKAGKDAFMFDTSPRSGRDFIKDFRVVDDTIRIDNADFTKVGSNGKLKAGAFWSNNSGKAHDASDRVIYDKDSGKLYYDVDGTGSKASVCFTDIGKNLKLTAADFFVV